MKKRLLIILICGVTLLVLTGCGNKKKYKCKGTELLNNYGNVIMSIEKSNINCVPVMLALYDDNQYELFTDYATCKFGKNCTDDLRYTKSIK